MGVSTLQFSIRWSLYTITGIMTSPTDVFCDHCNDILHGCVESEVFESDEVLDHVFETPHQSLDALASVSSQQCYLCSAFGAWLKSLQKLRRQPPIIFTSMLIRLDKLQDHISLMMLSRCELEGPRDAELTILFQPLTRR